MSIEGRVAVIERVIQTEEDLLKEIKPKLTLYYRSAATLEESLEANKKKLGRLRKIIEGKNK